jgi:hypothetical protein
VIALSGPDDGAAQPFPSGPSSLEGIDRRFAIKINQVEPDVDSQSDVRRRMILKPCLDHLGIGSAIVESVAAVLRGESMAAFERGANGNTARTLLATAAVAAGLAAFAGQAQAVPPQHFESFTLPATDDLGEGYCLFPVLVEGLAKSGPKGSTIASPGLHP